ncbi:hypothetical protein KZX47_05950 [Thermus sp. SYSU G05001]|jgi:hypothetical protein|uniref:Uncharacterized protein n=1 Tax=Thermus brevis TaxID=2862456 RepID=A0ABS6ZXZ6_9DEIN|nr:hypothetical protein [Thermus brevis]MBW6394695.1 hypothetical protein [Thermus brevis]
MDFREYLRESLKNPKDQRLYREALGEELAWLLRYLGETRGSRPDVGNTEKDALKLTLEEIARHAQALGLGLRLEFVTPKGEVEGRFTISPDEPV